MDWLASIIVAVFGDFTLRLMPLYVGATLLIAVVIYGWRYGWRQWRSFFRWLTPKDIYLHPSHIVDLKLFVVGRLLSVAGVINLVVVRTASAAFAMALLAASFGTEPGTGSWSWGQIALATLLFAVVSDFCTYWVHRIHHEYPVLWPFHSVHHSAEVLTPVTVYRKHPVYDLLSDAVSSLAIGFLAGALLFAISPNIDIISIGGANVVFVVFNAVGANFRHSHIWISYGPVLEHVLISPAQHQIHHSRAVVHHDRNYGEIFAIWDWMFGTLYVPAHEEKLEFGLAERDGTPIDQPHPSLARALIGPVEESWRQFRNRLAEPRPVADPPAE
ncbi:sterol desaturase family protein [Nitratireductor mangrovi]|uniref:Sterol desaturase family protein n=1 Tax=Nitratireductor mangrovi TaxID=2599600 RepID=A0A5B8KWL1_9HYPH|nr:sterol desaturase family protein [Nitratireductor mangrovi]QDY99928.1 sterol desaturase family protein [Nitratireductor mangrovi]